MADKNTHQKGFGVVEILIIIVILAVLSAVAYFALQRMGTVREEATQNNQAGQSASQQSCSTPKFTHYPTDISKATMIQNPIRKVNGDLKTHSYVEVSNRSPIYATADSTLTGGANYLETYGDRPITKTQYILNLEISCGIYYFYDHLVDVPAKIKNAFPATPGHDTRTIKTEKIEIKAGEIVGYTNQEDRGRFDFGVINPQGPKTSLTTNPTYKDNEIIKTSDKYQHAVCPYQYFESDKKNKLKSLFSTKLDNGQELIDDLCKGL